jgi:hypothetical protein
MITSILDTFTKAGTAVAADGNSDVIVNGYNNNSICDTLYLVVHRTAGTGTVGIKLQTSWDNSAWTDVVDFGQCAEDANGYLVKCKVPKGKPVLGKYLRLSYDVTTTDSVLGAFLTFGIDEDATEVVYNPAYTPGGAQPKV